MTEKVAIIADPGIDTAFAVTLALHDPGLELLALGATAGNVSAEIATRNVHIIIEQTDPPRWPQLGAALPHNYDIDGTQLHGTDGLGGVGFPCSRLHNLESTDRLVVDLVRSQPKEITVICLGPLTALSAILKRDPDFPFLIKRLVCLGGTIHDPGNAGPVSEFHFACDPLAARQVLQSETLITLVPLDVMRAIVYSPTDLMDVLARDSRACRFLRKIVPFGIRATSNIYGIEGFHLKDVLGIAAVAIPGALIVKPRLVDVETQGELTRGMSVIERRRGHINHSNVDMAVDVDADAVRGYIARVLSKT